MKEVPTVELLFGLNKELVRILDKDKMLKEGDLSNYYKIMVSKNRQLAQKYKI